MNFLSSILEETYQYYDILKSHTTPYHPAWNAIVERFNRTLQHLIRTEDRLAKSHELINFYNVTQHETTGFSPYF